MMEEVASPSDGADVNNQVPKTESPSAERASSIPPGISFISIVMLILGFLGVIAHALMLIAPNSVEDDLPGLGDNLFGILSVVVTLLTAVWLRRGDLRGRTLFLAGQPALLVVSIAWWGLDSIALLQLLFFVLGASLLLTSESYDFFGRPTTSPQKFGGISIPLDGTRPAFWIVLSTGLLALRLALHSVETNMVVGILLLVASIILIGYKGSNYKWIGALFIVLLVVTSPFVIAFLEGFLTGMRDGLAG